MKNYKQLFDDEFTFSQIIDDTFPKIKHEQGFEKAIEYLKSLNCKWLDEYSFTILYTINQFTLKEPTSDLNKLYNKIAEIEDVLEINYTDRFLNIKLKDYDIEVETLSKRNPGINKILDDIETSKRNGTCFEKAFRLGLGFKPPAKIVTGYTYGYTDKSKFLHSWVEITRDNKEYVVDGTLNAVINKEGFYKLRKVNVISEINKDDLIEDRDKYWDFIDEIGIYVYFVFRDEIINELKKNDAAFESKKILK